MKIAVGTWSYRKWFGAGKCDLFGFLEEVKAIGAEGVEIHPSHLGAEVSAESLGKLNDGCHERGLDVATLICANNFAASKVADRARAVAHMVRDIEVGTALGIDHFNVFSGYHEPGQDPQMELARVVDCFREVMPAAQEKGATLCIENHSTVAHDADSILWLIHAVRGENLWTNPDPTNFVPGYFDAPEALRERIYAETEKIAPLMANAHLKYRTFNPDGTHAHVDVARLLDIFRQVGYDRYIVLEYSGGDDPHEPTAACVALLKRLLDEG